MDQNYINYLSEVGPEYISMQANYLRMLANYYNNPELIDPKADSDQENVLERSLRAESVFVNNENNDVEPEKNPREVLSYSPPRKSSDDHNYEDYQPKATINQDRKIPFKANTYEEDADFMNRVEPIEVMHKSKPKGENSTKAPFQINSELPKRPERFSHNSFEDRPIKTASLPFDKLLERELKKTNSYNTGAQDKNMFAPRIKNNLIQKKNSSDDSPIESSEIQIKPKVFIEKPEATAKYEYLKRKSNTIASDINKFKESISINNEIDGDIPSETESTPIYGNRSSIDRASTSLSSTKTKYLKRGAGNLCLNKANIETKSSKSYLNKPEKQNKTFNKANKANRGSGIGNISKESSSDKSDMYPDIQFSDKEDDRNIYLEEQIQHYNNENKKLQKLMKEVEEKKRKLDKDRNDFLKEKVKAAEEFEKYKEEETHKIKRDKLVLEKKLKTQGKEKEEISALKAKIGEFQEIIEKKEKQHSEAIQILQKRIVMLSKTSKEPDPVFSDESSYEEMRTSVEKKPNFIEISSESGSEVSTPEKRPSIDYEPEQRSGKKEVVYNNGIKKEIYPDGYSIVYFNNKDVKQCFPDGRIVYHFSEAKTTQTTFPDGLQLFKFSNGQIEKHFPDGSKEISYEDGTVKCIYPDGQEESVFPDGTVQTLDSKGVKFIEFVNGQQDTIYPNGLKIRKFPDGRIRKIMPDGKIIDQ